MTEADLVNDLGTVVLKEIARQHQLPASSAGWDLRCNDVATKVLDRLRALGVKIDPAQISR